MNFPLTSLRKEKLFGKLGSEQKGVEENPQGDERAVTGTRLIGEDSQLSFGNPAVRSCGNLIRGFASRFSTVCLFGKEGSLSMSDDTNIV